MGGVGGWEGGSGRFGMGGSEWEGGSGKFGIGGGNPGRLVRNLYFIFFQKLYSKRLGFRSFDHAFIPPPLPFFPPPFPP